MLTALLTAFSFLSCSQKTKTVYIKSPCPVLKTWEQNITVPKLKIDFRSVPDGFSLKEKEFYAWADYTRELKQLFIDSLELNRLYKLQNLEFNEKFKRAAYDH